MLIDYMQKIVFILGSYYPKYSAVGKCVNNIALQAKRNGYQVTIISMKTNTDDEFFSSVDGCSLIKVSTKDNDYFLHAKENKNKIIDTVNKINRNVKLLLSKQTIKKDLVIAYNNALDNLGFVPNYVIPACLPFESVVSATNYSKKHHECAMIPLLFDMFSNNTSLLRNNFIMNIKKRSNSQLEKEMLSEAKKVLCLDTWESYVKNNYEEHYDKCIVIKPPLLVDSRKWGYDDKSEVVYYAVYSGSVDKFIRNPIKMLDFIVHYNKERNNNRINVSFFSTGSATNILVDYSKRYNFFSYKGFIETERVHRIINNAHFLISIGNQHTNQTPSKIYEYISTGLPIIHFAFDYNDRIIKELEEYPLKYIVYLNSDYEDQAEKLEDFIVNNNDKRIDFETIKKMYNYASPEYVFDLLIS